jgi:hypothetical protein
MQENDKTPDEIEVAFSKERRYQCLRRQVLRMYAGT